MGSFEQNPVLKPNINPIWISHPIKLTFGYGWISEKVQPMH